MESPDYGDVDNDSNTSEVLRFSYHTQLVGSVTHVTAPTGGVVERYLYGPYGKPTIQDGSGSAISASAIENPYLFTGRQLDAETQQYYFRARTYSPRLRRFVQRDPLEYSDGPNALGYVRMRPTKLVDPDGTISPEYAAAAAVAAVSDGPLPIGDIVAVGILIYAAIETGREAGRQLAREIPINRTCDATPTPAPESEGSESTGRPRGPVDVSPGGRARCPRGIPRCRKRRIQIPDYGQSEQEACDEAAQIAYGPDETTAQVAPTGTLGEMDIHVNVYIDAEFVGSLVGRKCCIARPDPEFFWEFKKPAKYK